MREYFIFILVLKRITFSSTIYIFEDFYPFTRHSTGQDKITLYVFQAQACGNYVALDLAFVASDANCEIPGNVMKLIHAV